MDVTINNVAGVRISHRTHTIDSSGRVFECIVISIVEHGSIEPHDKMVRHNINLHINGNAEDDQVVNLTNIEAFPGAPTWVEALPMYRSDWEKAKSSIFSSIMNLLKA